MLLYHRVLPVEARNDFDVIRLRRNASSQTAKHEVTDQSMAPIPKVTQKVVVKYVIARPR